MKLQCQPATASSLISNDTKATTASFGCLTVPGNTPKSAPRNQRKTITTPQSNGKPRLCPLTTDGHNGHTLERILAGADLCLRELSQVSNVRIRFCCSASASPVEETSGSGLPTHHQMVLMEVELPNVSGVECVQRLRELFPDMQVVMHTVSVHDNTPADTSAPYDGSGPLAFSVAVPEDESLAGGDPSAFNAYPGKESGSMNANDRSSLESAPLSKREEEILRYVAKGLINKEIADVLDISLETVRSHLKNIYEKLHVRSRTEAVVKHWHD